GSDADVVEGHPVKTIDVPADDGTICRYRLAEWVQSRRIRGLLVPVPRLAARHVWVVVRSFTTAVGLLVQASRRSRRRQLAGALANRPTRECSLPPRAGVLDGQARRCRSGRQGGANAYNLITTALR